MKKNIKLLSALSLTSILFAGTLMSSSNVEDAANKVGVRHTYIVTLKDSYTPNKRGSFLANLGTLLNQQYTIEATYSELFQGYAISFPETMIASVRGLTGVTGVYGTSAYSAPEDNGDSTYATDSKTSYSRETMDVDWNKQTNKGAGATIGIIDTGIFYTQVAESRDDTSEKAFRPLSASAHEKAQFKSQSDVDKITSQSSFIGRGAKFVNDKIFYAYDYSGDNDSNAQSVSGNEHGTHVASLAGANGYSYQGIAPDSQIAVLKVFGDESSGATTTDIIEALEDSVRLGLDVVNMSLGQGLYSYPGYETESIESLAIQACQKQGMILNVSAGNDGRENYNGTTGFYAESQTTDTVETGVLGSYATLSKWDNSIASGTSTYVDIGYIGVVDATTGETQKISNYDDQVSTLPFSSLFEGETQEYDFVKVPGIGAEENYTGLNVQGKIAVVQRGSNTFLEKYQQAAKHKASGLIVLNTDDQSLSMSFSGITPTIPIIMIPKSTADLYFTATEGKIQYVTDKKQENKNVGNWQEDTENNTRKYVVTYTGHERELSTFSSDGPNTDLTMGIDIAAPGEQANGAVGYGYEKMSGTSMSAPNFSGAMAMIISEYRSQHQNTDGTYDTDAVAAYRSKVMARIQSTALPLQDTDDETLDGDKVKQVIYDEKGYTDKSGHTYHWYNYYTNEWVDEDSTFTATQDTLNYASPRRQGGGMVQVGKAVESKVYFEQYDASKSGEDKGTGKAKIEFLNSQDIAKGTITPEVLIHNETSSAVNYKAKLYITTPTAEVGIDQDTWMKKLSASQQAAVASNIQSTILQKNQNHYIGTYEYESTVTINPTTENGAGQLLSLPSIDLTDVNSSDEQVKTLATKLQNYMTNFQYGTYLEGYLILEPVTETEETPTINVPYFGFYGDYGEAPAVEDFDFERDTSKTSNSDIETSIAHNLSGGSATADLGSHIFAGSDSKATGVLDAAYAAIGRKSYASIGLYNAGVDYNKNPYDEIVVGVKDKSDVLYIQQYMNRTCDYGTVQILDSNGNAVSDEVDMFSFPTSSYGSLDWVDEQGKTRHVLQKSFVTQSGLSSGYYAPLTHARVPLKDSNGNSLSEGNYQLKFFYRLAAKDGDGNNYTQTKTVNFRVGQDIKPAVLGKGKLFSNDVIYIDETTARIKNAEEELTIASYRGSRYISLSEVPTLNGYASFTVISTTGCTYNVLMDTYRDDATAIYGTDLSTVAYYTINSAKDEANSATKFTANVYNKQNRTDNGYTHKEHGISIKVSQEVKEVFAYNESGEKISLDSIGASYQYNTSRNYLNVYLPSSYVSFGVIYN